MNDNKKTLPLRRSYSQRLINSPNSAQNPTFLTPPNDLILSAESSAESSTGSAIESAMQEPQRTSSPLLPGVNDLMVVDEQTINTVEELRPAVILGPDSHEELEIINKRPSFRPILRKSDNNSSNPLEDFSEDRFDTKKESYLAGYIAGMNAASLVKRRGSY